MVDRHTGGICQLVLALKSKTPLTGKQDLLILWDLCNPCKWIIILIMARLPQISSKLTLNWGDSETSLLFNECLWNYEYKRDMPGRVYQILIWLNELIMIIIYILQLKEKITWRLTRLKIRSLGNYTEHRFVKHIKQNQLDNQKEYHVQVKIHQWTKWVCVMGKKTEIPTTHNPVSKESHLYTTLSAAAIDMK